VEEALLFAAAVADIMVATTNSPQSIVSYEAA
jgi:hypothetical protein